MVGSRSKSRKQGEEDVDTIESPPRTIIQRLTHRKKLRTQLSRRNLEHSLIYDQLTDGHSHNLVRLPSFDIDDMILPLSSKDKTKLLLRQIDDMIIQNHGIELKSIFENDGASSYNSRELNKENIPEIFVKSEKSVGKRKFTKADLPIVDLHKEIKETRFRHDRSRKTFISNDPYENIIMGKQNLSSIELR